MVNFKNSTALARQQDEYINIYKSGGHISDSQINDMEYNAWVATAAKMAPGNLVARQWALVDLFKNSAAHRGAILNIVNTLSYKQVGAYRLWAEGYSYFNYTMDVIKPWIEKFQGSHDLSDLKNIIQNIEQGFIITSYSRNGVWYPAPYGDLRNEPLAPELQQDHELKTVRVTEVIFNYLASEKRIWYSITGRPIGLNTHIPKNDSTITIVNGVPANFRFYTGYQNKYKNTWEEYMDTYHIKRLKSIPF